MLSSSSSKLPCHFSLKWLPVQSCNLRWWEKSFNLLCCYCGEIQISCSERFSYLIASNFSYWNFQKWNISHSSLFSISKFQKNFSSASDSKIRRFNFRFSSIFHSRFPFLLMEREHAWLWNTIQSSQAMYSLESSAALSKKLAQILQQSRKHKKTQQTFPSTPLENARFSLFEIHKINQVGEFFEFLSDFAKLLHSLFCSGRVWGSKTQQKLVRVLMLLSFFRVNFHIHLVFRAAATGEKLWSVLCV